MSNSPADTESSEERGSAPDAGAEIALKPMEKTMVEQMWLIRRHTLEWSVPEELYSVGKAHTDPMGGTLHRSRGTVYGEGNSK